MTQHPRDEFDDVPESPRRQGAHRIRESRRAGLPEGLGAILIAGCIALLIGAACFILGGTSSRAVSPQRTSVSAEAPAASQGSVGTSADAASSSASPSAEPDRSTPANVYNSTYSVGLGATALAEAVAKGWAPGKVANWEGPPVMATVVYYRGTAQKAAAETLTADLNVTTTPQEVSDLAVPLAVVLGSDFS